MSENCEEKMGKRSRPCDASSTNASAELDFLNAIDLGSISAVLSNPPAACCCGNGDPSEVTVSAESAESGGDEDAIVSAATTESAETAETGRRLLGRFEGRMKLTYDKGKYPTVTEVLVDAAATATGNGLREGEEPGVRAMASGEMT